MQFLQSILFLACATAFVEVLACSGSRPAAWEPDSPNSPYRRDLLNPYSPEGRIFANKSGDCPMFASKQGDQPKLPCTKEAPSSRLVPGYLGTYIACVVDQFQASGRERNVYKSASQAFCLAGILPIPSPSSSSAPRISQTTPQRC
ncbi:hypothetical protein PCASD_12676 [Puccinia coronata f. sp. avenae]|uniref:Secreted protein n=1 Tax=Puccinia coronata f. sp. avenae TaxID=200324 RepID=A0A2N5UE19_9BASI|nr:hypothetical protein PCASD_12676 [Puccinia coronata f. sp. avenae]